MKKKKISGKTLFIILGLVSIGTLAAIGTYAYFGWSSDKDASISVTSVDGLGQCNKIADNQKMLWPVSSRDKGRIVSINTKQTLSEYAYIVWTLTIDSINRQDTETDGLKHKTFKYELVNTTTGISYGSGNFEGLNVGDTITFSNNTENLAYNTNYKFTLYLWIDGTIGANPMDMTNQTYQFSLVCDITGEGTNKAQDKSPENAAEYITNLYTNAQKSTATVNNITYNLAPSVNLMNDRHASMSTGADAGDIRYYGANPNNYVWLGDSYTSDYTIPGNITSWGYADKQECINDGKIEADCTEDIVRHTGDRKLWRVIGVFNGRVKLIQDDPIGNYSWDTSENNTTGGNSGYGINQWGESTYSDTGEVYPGADLMRLLNPGYESATINNSLYWSKGTGTVYTAYNNTTTADVSFANTGLTTSEKNMIDTATWYTGAYDQYSYVDSHYTAERGSMGKICTSVKYCNDEVIRTNTWNGKVGLINESDYGYAADLALCNQTMAGYYSNTGCIDNDWLSTFYVYWTMSPRAYSDPGPRVFRVSSVFSVGGFSFQGSSDAGAVRPAVYLKSGVSISGGNGSQSDPFVLSLNS